MKTREIISLASILLLAAVCSCGIADEIEYLNLQVSASKTDYIDIPLCATIELPESLVNLNAEEISVTVRRSGTNESEPGVLKPGQIVTIDPHNAELWWVAPLLKKADGMTLWTATLRRKETTNEALFSQFSWQNIESQYLDLLFNGQKVTRYMYKHDTSSEQLTFETYKPFHHVFDSSGNLLTNGPDGINPYIQDEILYPHHRGIFIGWNKLTFDNQQYDLWHMREAHQVHQEFEGLIAGPVLAKSQALINWNDNNGEPIIAEQRRTTVFRQSYPTILLLDFHTELRAVKGEVFLDGDPEHGGFQYRAHNDVAAGGKEVKATYLFHEDGIDPRTNFDLPWVAMSYGLNNQRYNVQHINHPDNPKPTIYSAYRDYGRFGAFFKETIASSETLTLRYRILVGYGEIPKRPELANRYSAFVNKPKVYVIRP
jgi:hypothetical protein